MHMYFAYGSNLSREQMLERCPNSEPLFRAHLPGYRLDFTYYSPRRGGGTADIVPSNDDSVWGAVYSISDADLAALDKAEECPNIYRRIRVEILCDRADTETTAPTPTNGDAERVAAWTYEVVRKRSTVEPSRGYLELVAEGAAEWNLPEEYQDCLRSFEHEDDEHEHSHDD